MKRIIKAGIAFLAMLMVLVLSSCNDIVYIDNDKNSDAGKTDGAANQDFTYSDSDD